MIPNQPSTNKHRPIRSYVLRMGRMTHRQQQALDQLWPAYGINLEPGEPLDLDTLFGRQAPHICEIGFGMGDSLLQMAQHNPNIDYVGIEVHQPGIGALLAAIQQHDINNIRLLHGDAATLLPAHFAPNTWDGFHIFFPDPWPKKRHHKRRLLQQPFLSLLQRQLKPNGHLHIATDWQDYAEATLTLLQHMPGFINQTNHNTFLPRPAWRPETKFEKRGIRHGHDLWDLLFKKL